MNLREAKCNVDLLTKFAFIDIIKESTHPMAYVKFHGVIGTVIGIVEQKVFLFSDFLGGKDEAVYWAQQWRDETYLKLLMANTVEPIPCKTPIAFTGVRGINKSGKCGVQLNDHYNKRRTVLKDGTVRHYTYHVYEWAATYRKYIKLGKKIRRQSTQRRFSIKKWGFYEAKQMAYTSRDQALLEISRPDNLRRRELWRLDKTIRA
jgi:hypothetical protein